MRQTSMSRLACAVSAAALASIFTPTVGLAETFPYRDDAMSFALARPADKTDCAECTWIAADGPITTETVSDFLGFLAEHGEDLSAGMTLHLNSRGGNVRAAYRLADIIRLQGFYTTVSLSHGERTGRHVRVVQEVDTAPSEPAADAVEDPLAAPTDPVPGLDPEEDHADSAPDAVCAAECLLLFAAGQERFAHPNTDRSYVSGQRIGALEIGALETHDHDGGQPHDVSSSLARGDDPITTGELLDLFTRLGVSSEFLQMVRAMPAGITMPLSASSIMRFSFDTTVARSAGLKPYPNGVAIYEIGLRTPLTESTIEFYCQADRLKALFTVKWETDQDSVELTNLAILQNLSLNGQPLTSVTVDHSVRGGFMTSRVDTVLSPDAWDILDGQGSFFFTDDTNQHASGAASQLNFTLHEPVQISSVLRETCL